MALLLKQITQLMSFQELSLVPAGFKSSIPLWLRTKRIKLNVQFSMTKSKVNLQTTLIHTFTSKTSLSIKLKERTWDMFLLMGLNIGMVEIWTLNKWYLVHSTKDCHLIGNTDLICRSLRKIILRLHKLSRSSWRKDNVKTEN